VSRHEPLLKVEGLSVELATPRGALHAVRDVSLSIPPGDTLCLVGESGCGKSMTAYALMGLLPRSAKRTVAKFMFQGEDLSRTSAARLGQLRGNRMAMVFQYPMTALNPAYPILDQLVEVHCRHLGSTRAQARDRAVELLGQVGITAPAERLYQYPHQLSGGLCQRVVIAMALMCGPALLIADEPTSALDVTIQAQILRLFADLQRTLGISMLLITHDLGVVARVAHRVMVMYAGEVVEDGTVAEVFAAPRHPYTRGLMASIPVPSRTIPGARLGAIPGTVPSLIGDLSGCAFRNRCAYAAGVCAEKVDLRREGDRHWRCVLATLPAAAARPAGCVIHTKRPG
jgi:peptide/nickel transport system ATP-binding protein